MDGEARSALSRSASALGSWRRRADATVTVRSCAGFKQAALRPWELFVLAALVAMVGMARAFAVLELAGVAGFVLAVVSHGFTMSCMARTLLLMWASSSRSWRMVSS